MKLAVLSVCVSVCLCTQIGGNMHSNERLLVLKCITLSKDLKLLRNGTSRAYSEFRFTLKYKIYF